MGFYQLDLLKSFISGFKKNEIMFAKACNHSTSQAGLLLPAVKE